MFIGIVQDTGPHMGANHARKIIVHKRVQRSRQGYIFSSDAALFQHEIDAVTRHISTPTPRQIVPSLFEFCAWYISSKKILLDYGQDLEDEVLDRLRGVQMLVGLWGVKLFSPPSSTTSSSPVINSSSSSSHKSSSHSSSRSHHSSSHSPNHSSSSPRTNISSTNNNTSIDPQYSTAALLNLSVPTSPNSATGSPNSNSNSNPNSTSSPSVSDSDSDNSTDSESRRSHSSHSSHSSLSHSANGISSHNHHSSSHHHHGNHNNNNHHHSLSHSNSHGSLSNHSNPISIRNFNNTNVFSTITYLVHKNKSWLKYPVQIPQDPHR